MSFSRIGAVPLRLSPFIGRSALTPRSSASCLLRIHLQTRSKHNKTIPRSTKNARPPTTKYTPPREPTEDEFYGTGKDPLEEAFTIDHAEWPNVKVRYLRPAVWALIVSGGIFGGLSFLQARQELKPKKSQGWYEAPQWGMQTRKPPTPTELAAQQWAQMNSMSKLSCGIIGANAAVHLSSFVVPQMWRGLWHMPARNVNYTQFTSMFVHSGAFHFFVNMYFTYNFMAPVGYSQAFEGNPYHILSFFLSTGVLSGFAQHWATLIPQKRAIPEIFVRCGGASGALLGMLGVFCMQYPTAGLGIMFIPVHFDAQYVLPAIMLFDFVGMVRGYSFVNFGHAVSFNVALLYSALTLSRLISPARSSGLHIPTWTARTRSGIRW
jgi:rhomboid-like protein